MSFEQLDIATETTQADALTNLQNAATALQNILDAVTSTLEIDSVVLALKLETINASITALLEVDGTRATSAKQDTAQTTFTTISTTLTAISGYVDGLEGFTDGIESLLTTIGGYVDGLETNTANLAKTDVVSTLTNNRKTVTAAGTAEALVATATPCKWVRVCAFGGNTQQVQIGGSGVVAASGSSTGVLLFAGEKETIPVDDVHKVFVDARVSGEGVSFYYGS